MMMMMRLVMANLFLKYRVVTALASIMLMVMELQESWACQDLSRKKIKLLCLVNQLNINIIFIIIIKYYHHHHYQKACSCGLKAFSTSFLSCVIHVCQTSSGNSRYGSLTDHNLLAIYQFAFAIAYTVGWKRAYHCFLLLK